MKLIFCIIKFTFLTLISGREEYRNSIKRKLSRNTPAQEIKSVKVNQFSAEYSEVRESNSKVCKSKRSSSISDRTPQSKKNYEFSSRITAPTKSSEMKLQRKWHQDVDLAPKLEQKEIESSNSENDSDSFTTPVISAGIKIEDINVNSVGEDKTPHISASQELFTHDWISSEINCKIVLFTNIESYFIYRSWSSQNLRKWTKNINVE